MMRIKKQLFIPLKENHHRRQRPLTGFTLMELIVVMVIIGVLASIIYPKLTRAREEAMDVQAQIILKTIRAAERNYKMKHGDYCCSPALDTVDAINDNDNLGLDLADDNQWDNYIVVSFNNNQKFIALLLRNRGGYRRQWIIDNVEENATCSHLASPNDWCPSP